MVTASRDAAAAQPTGYTLATTKVGEEAQGFGVWLCGFVLQKCFALLPAWLSV